MNVCHDSCMSHGAQLRHVLCQTCVAVCCSVLQCVAVCCSVLQCVAVCCSVLSSCVRHVASVRRVTSRRVCVCCCVNRYVATVRHDSCMSHGNIHKHDATHSCAMFDTTHVCTGFTHTMRTQCVVLIHKCVTRLIHECATCVTRHTQQVGLHRSAHGTTLQHMSDTRGVATVRHDSCMSHGTHS